MTTLLVCLFDKLGAVIVVTEDAFNHPGRSNKLYLWDVLQAHWVMLEFVKVNFTGNPKCHLQMVMFILETIFPQMELEGVSVACANVSTRPVTVKKLASSVDAFESLLCDLEATTGLEVGGRVDI